MLDWMVGDGGHFGLRIVQSVPPEMAAVKYVCSCRFSIVHL